MDHPRILMTAGLALVMMSSAAAAAGLSSTLECRTTDLLAGEPNLLVQAGREAGFDCRVHEQQRQTMVYCTGSGNVSAFGVPVKEFNLAKEVDGSAVLSVAFNDPPSKLQPLLDRARASASTTPDTGVPLDTAVIDEREDGVAELRCSVGGRGDGAGAIAGTLDFRGMQPIPAMRVCAAPVRSLDSPHCVQTVSGQPDYLIEGLPKGDYYVTAFALDGNPNRLFGVYTSALQTCPAGTINCADQRLQRVTVFAGDVRSGIDPNTLMSNLPSPLRSSASAR